MFVLLGVVVCVALFNFPCSNIFDIRVKFSCQTHFVCIGGTSTSASKSTGGSQSSQKQRTNYQIPASALYEAAEELKGSLSTSSGRAGNSTYQYTMDVFGNLFPFVTHGKKNKFFFKKKQKLLKHSGDART